MITLAEFEGISGYRWGALLRPDGALVFSENAPNPSPKKVELIGRVITQAPFFLSSADLFFDMGKVLVRRGTYGLLLIVCEDQANVSMIDIVLLESHHRKVTESESLSSSGSSSSLLDRTDASLSDVSISSKDDLPVPLEIIEDLLGLYTRFLGPLARTLAIRECRSAGLDMGKIVVRDWTRLLNILSGKISDQSKHEDFLDQAVMLKTKF